MRMYALFKFCLAKAAECRRNAEQATDPARRRSWLNTEASFMVKFCFARAAECRRNAELATDPTRRRSWLNTEGKWFLLARSYDSERRTDLSVASDSAHREAPGYALRTAPEGCHTLQEQQRRVRLGRGVHRRK